ncbi:MAG: ABC transporter permease [Clostridia bacterium]|nr:ABC transporter permease [Clostridia bacterium]
MRKSLARIYALSKRNAKEIVRDPLSLIFMIGLPLFMEILFYLLFHKQTDQFEMKYLAPGIVVFSQAFLSLFTGQLIALDRSSSLLTRLYVSRATSVEFILSYALPILPLTLIQSVLFFLVGGIVDPGLFGWRMPLAILLGLVTSLFFIGMGILFGSICNEKSIGWIASILIACQSLLSGMWFPTEGLGGGMVALMNALPFRNATQLMQNTILGFGDAWSGFWRPMLILLAYSLAAFVCAVLVFKKKMKQ